jgi:hypothetical protein
MNQDTTPVPRETIDYITSELERLMNDAGARWILPKSDNKARFEGWRGRELAYREALRMFADAGLAPKYAQGQQRT